MSTDKRDHLHNELMDYPCKFTIKAMGYAHIDLNSIVVDIVQRHAPVVNENAIQLKFSTSKKYASLSVTITAESKSQMDAIYQDLSDCEHVLMSL